MNEIKEVFKIWDVARGQFASAYSRAYHDEYEFRSAEYARESNCHGIFKDREKYKIQKYRVTYELIEGDVE